MKKYSLGVPVKTRLPVQAWAIAGAAAAFSILFSHLHVEAASHWSVYAGVAQILMPCHG